MNRRTNWRLGNGLLWVGVMALVSSVAWAATESVSRPEVSIWAGKGSSYGLAFTAKKGDKLEVLAAEENDWLKVQMGGKTGYVRKPALQEQSSALGESSGRGKAGKATIAAAAKGGFKAGEFAKARKISTEPLIKLVDSKRRVAGERWRQFTAEGNLAPGRDSTASVSFLIDLPDSSNFVREAQLKLPGIGGSRRGGNDALDIGSKLVKTAQEMNITREQEEEIGLSLAYLLTNPPYPVYDDAALTDYVTSVGLTIAAVSKDPDYDYVFGVIDRDDVAAYSAPTGFVFVSRGALAAMEDEAELAGLLAHEIGHVAREHGIKAVKDKKATDFGINLAASELTKGQEIELLSKMTDTASDTIVKRGFGPGQETEADREAVKYLKAAGYEPSGYVRFLERLAKKQGGRTKFLGTHPGLDKRVRDTRKELGGQQGGATLKDRFTKETAALRK